MPIRPATRLVAIAALVVCAACSPPNPPFARLAGLIVNGELDEVSGLAASHAHEDVLWAVNDSGNSARLYAISPRGRLLGRYQVDGAKNYDWEDLASFDLGGRHYLLVADVGDNGGIREDFELHVFEEPATLARSGRLQLAWTIRARWPDGARNCEAVAVDARNGTVLLVSKQRKPPELFALPLADPHGMVRTARLLGHLGGVPQASEALQESEPALARYAGQITSADLSPDGRMLAVLSYSKVLFYRRQPGQGWAKAIAEPVELHDVPPIPQAEALAWSTRGGGLYATGEFKPAPIFWLSPDTR